MVFPPFISRNIGFKDTPGLPIPFIPFIKERGDWRLHSFQKSTRWFCFFSCKTRLFPSKKQKQWIKRDTLLGENADSMLQRDAAASSSWLWKDPSMNQHSKDWDPRQHQGTFPKRKLRVQTKPQETTREKNVKDGAREFGNETVSVGRSLQKKVREEDTNRTAHVHSSLMPRFPP